MSRTENTMIAGATSRRVKLVMTTLVVFSTAGASCDFARFIGPDMRANPLSSIETFAVYFGGTFEPELGCYDMAIIDPDAHTAQEVASLRDGGTLTIAYLSVGEAEAYRWFYPQVDPSWLLGPNPNWRDHFYVDAREEGWQALLLDTVIPRIVDRGYEGLFLDMVDTALPGLFPETAVGMIELIHRIRSRYPDLRVIMNRGFFLAHMVAGSVDGLAVEGVFARYDFSNGSYGQTPPDTRDALLRRLEGLVASYDYAPFVIDYAAAGDDDLRDYAKEGAAEHDLPTFVSTLALDAVPLPDGVSGLAECAAPPPPTSGPDFDLGGAR